VVGCRRTLVTLAKIISQIRPDNTTPASQIGNSHFLKISGNTLFQQPEEFEKPQFKILINLETVVTDQKRQTIPIRDDIVSDVPNRNVITVVFIAVGAHQ
jgi:hypothetical protein